MIFFLNQNGTCTRQDTDHIYQGSNNASKVIAITSVAPIQSFLQVAFTLPNSLTYGYLPMAYKGAYQVGGDTDNQMYLYELDLPYNVTEVQGEVGVSFNVVNSVTGANMTSYTNTFNVEYSALPIPPASASESELEQILNLLNAYYAQNTGIITTHTSQIQAIQTEQTTQNNAISTLQAQSTSLQQAVTKNTSDIAEIKTEQAQQDEEIEKLKEASVIGETPVGTLPSSATMPTDTEIQAYYAQNVGREPRVGDVFFFTQTLPRGYKVYKYIYGATGWAYFEIPGANVGSNPNMLDNPDSAINQRGITTLSQGTGFMSDRWYKMAGSNSTKIDIENGIYTITITATSPSWNISRTLTQTIECSESLWSKQVTFSVNVIEPVQNKDFSIFVYALNAQQNIIGQTQSFVYLDSIGLKYITYTVPQNAVFLQVAIDVNIKNGVIGNFVKFTEPKLEPGTVPTKFLPPNPAEELPKCQRYFLSLTPKNWYRRIALGYFATATKIRYLLSFPTYMRAEPTVTIGDNLVDFSSGGILTHTYSVATNYNALLEFDCAKNGVVNNPSVLYNTNTTKIWFDAEL